ncbi:MAG: hypothetical protein AAGI63_09130 [Planctomycetota bacterium]
MQFRIQHLLLIVAVFALSLASGFPGSFLMPDPAWKVVSIHQETALYPDSLDAHPSLGDAGVRRDYVATVQNGRRTQRINLGDTVLIAQHRLQLPDVGSYVEIRRLTEGHGELPVASIEAPSRIWFVLAMFLSFMFSVLLVFGSLMIRWFSRRQVFLYRERRMIDRATRTPAST